jgi:glutamate synthase domain-containing protein 2/glutamate synthase domain-containing protein 1/glutamate synthase domain-containing protein 3
MYEPFYEHDACGVGFVANIDGKKTHQIIRQGLQVLENLEHRGACGCDPDTGDGAGMIVQTPDRFFRREADRLGFDLPEFGTYATGMLFLPHSDSDRKTCEAIIERSAVEEGQAILGWRDVPHDADAIGWLAREGMPVIRQVFIQAAQGLGVDAFERKLFTIRKVIEHAVIKENLQEADRFYISSLSARTVCYKGLMLAPQTDRFYQDLSEDDFESAIALVHQRYSTNTFPSWPLAQPFRFLAHNGEINTLRGNLNMLRSREVHIESELFGEDIKKLAPIHTVGASDSASFDESYELLLRGGRTPAHAMMMMVPEPWQGHESMPDAQRAFYEYHACLQEPWDGPASMAFTDGVQIGAVLDRNGLRPSRYWVTDDNFVVMASEAGVLDVPEERIVKKGRLQPGRMFLIDTEEQRIVNDEEIKESICSRKPYRKWLETHRVDLPDASFPANDQQNEEAPLLERQQVFGYTLEDQELLLYPMALDGVQPLGSMGNDTPLAVLSKRPQLLFNYFKQLFAQVTNPPIDPIREENVMSLETDIGCERNLLSETPEHCEQLHLQSPIITNDQLDAIKRIDEPGIKSTVISTLFPAKDGAAGVEDALDRICREASEAIADGVTILILSDRGVNRENCPLSSLLATGAVHHHLVRELIRTECGIVVESGEPREVMHFCLLTGYGAGAISPYLAFETLDEAVRNELIVEEFPGSAHKQFIKAIEKGMLKTMAKIGISTQHSYRSAQIFEALGLGESLVDRCFTGTASRIGGIELEDVGRESLIRHAIAYPKERARPRELDPGGFYHWRKRGEFHQYNPETVSRIQHAVRSNSEQKYREYAEMVNSRDRNASQLRALFNFKKDPIPIEEVEAWTEIVKRFCTGAMSYGSISLEAHENLAIAMNRIGGRSNTGEGGEDPKRFARDENGDLRRSSIKQVASGRFGVTNEYLVNSDEIQIKMAQGAKPGEGGELPGRKVFKAIAQVRYSTPGVGLISPPPHHDIYSIEDLAQLIHDLKNANVEGNVSVKLVSEVGVGTVAAGVAKGKSDLVTISGGNGGTGASPLSSIKHAGLPWELGLSETHQVLVENDLRSRIRVQTDGQMKTGRDVAIGFLLGADEVGFATLPLVASGCIMMRKCHLNTCPVGIATQDPELRKKFNGQPEHVVNLFHFIAEECREIMAELGFRTVDEMIGRADRLEYDPLPDHWKAHKLDLSRVLHVPEQRRSEATLHCSETQDHGIDKALDHTLITKAAPALQAKERLEDVDKVRFDVDIRNINRTVGTMLSSALTRQHKLGMYTGSLNEDTVWIDCHGCAGQSFGAFSVKGVTLNVDGEANDYCGKGLSGGKIIVRPPSSTTITPEENIVVGNVALYGATAGEAYFRGIAGERFCVRNSGAWAVAEGVGDHACEYMTGGRAIVLGPTGRNFAAGMSGGIAFVYDPAGAFPALCNPGLVDLKTMNEESRNDLRFMLERHVAYTESTVAQRILENWDVELNHFVRVMPRDYARVLKEIDQAAGEPEMAEV